MKATHKTCDECGSPLFDNSSKMESVCSECAHILYGYPRCDHDFVSSKCIKCGWDGSVSDYIGNKKLKALKNQTTTLSQKDSLKK